MSPQWGMTNCKAVGEKKYTGKVCHDNQEELHSLLTDTIHLLIDIIHLLIDIIHLLIDFSISAQK